MTFIHRLDTEDLNQTIHISMHIKLLPTYLPRYLPTYLLGLYQQLDHLQQTFMCGLDQGGDTVLILS